MVGLWIQVKNILDEVLRPESPVHAGISEPDFEFFAVVFSLNIRGYADWGTVWKRRVEQNFTDIWLILIEGDSIRFMANVSFELIVQGFHEIWNLIFEDFSNSVFLLLFRRCELGNRCDYD